MQFGNFLFHCWYSCVPSSLNGQESVGARYLVGNITNVEGEEPGCFAANKDGAENAVMRRLIAADNHIG